MIHPVSAKLEEGSAACCLLCRSPASLFNPLLAWRWRSRRLQLRGFQFQQTCLMVLISSRSACWMSAHPTSYLAASSDAARRRWRGFINTAAAAFFRRQQLAARFEDRHTLRRAHGGKRPRAPSRASALLVFACARSAQEPAGSGGLSHQPEKCPMLRPAPITAAEGGERSAHPAPRLAASRYRLFLCRTSSGRRSQLRTVKQGLRAAPQ